MNHTINLLSQPVKEVSAWLTTSISLPDCRTVLYHPDVGTANLHPCGIGKITVSAAGDLTSHTTTADGYVVYILLATTISG